MSNELPIESCLRQADAHSGSRFYRYSLAKSELEPVYAYAAAGFPEGNEHGWPHILRVLEYLDKLLAPAPLQYLLSPHELYLAMMAVLFHDVGILQRRDDHPKRAADLLKRLGSDKFGLEQNDREIICAAVASHGSRTSIDDNCRRFLETETIRGERVRPRVIAALVRMADELDEDARRAEELTQFFRGDTLPASSRPFWKFCQRIAGIHLHAAPRDIEVIVAFHKEDTTLRVGDGMEEKGFVDWSLDKLKKVNRERIECNRHLPETLRLRELRVMLRPWEGLAGWRTTTMIVLDDRTGDEDITRLLPEELRGSAAARLLCVSIDEDAAALARPVWRGASEAEVARWHMDVLAAGGVAGRRDPESIRRARSLVEELLRQKGVTGHQNETRIHLKTPLSVATWLGAALRYLPVVAAYNYLRRENRFVEFSGLREELRYAQLDGDYELLKEEIGEEEEPGSTDAVVVFDALGIATKAQLTCFVDSGRPVKARWRRRLLPKSAGTLEPHHLRPALRDFVRLMGRLRSEGAGVFHLAFSAPDVVAFFAGTQLNQLLPIKLYEWDKGEGGAAPAYQYVFDAPTALPVAAMRDTAV